MAEITLRETKGSPLTFAEADANFTNLDNDKQEIIPNLSVDTIIDVDFISFLFMIIPLVPRDLFYLKI